MNLKKFVKDFIKDNKEEFGHSNNVVTTVNKPDPQTDVDRPCWSHLWEMRGINSLIVLVPEDRCNEKMLNWIVNSPQYGECFLTKTYEDALVNGLWMDTSKPWHLLWSSLIAVRSLFEFNQKFDFVEDTEHDRINLSIAYYFALFYYIDDKQIRKHYNNTNHYPILDDQTTLTNFLEVNLTPRKVLFYPERHSVSDARVVYGHNIALSMFLTTCKSELKHIDRWGNESPSTQEKFVNMVKEVGVNQTLINFTNDKELW